MRITQPFDALCGHLRGSSPRALEIQPPLCRRALAAPSVPKRRAWVTRPVGETEIRIMSWGTKQRGKRADSRRFCNDRKDKFLPSVNLFILESCCGVTLLAKREEWERALTPDLRRPPPLLGGSNCLQRRLWLLALVDWTHYSALSRHSIHPLRALALD